MKFNLENKLENTPLTKPIDVNLKFTFFECSPFLSTTPQRQFWRPDLLSSCFLTKRNHFNLTWTGGDLSSHYCMRHPWPPVKRQATHCPTADPKTRRPSEPPCGCPMSSSTSSTSPAACSPSSTSRSLARACGCRSAARTDRPTVICTGRSWADCASGTAASQGPVSACENGFMFEFVTLKSG